MFIPATPKEMKELGWDSLDIIIVSGTTRTGKLMERPASTACSMMPPIRNTKIPRD